MPAFAGTRLRTEARLKAVEGQGRTRLLANRNVPADDHRVAAMVDALPPPAFRHATVKAGITNEDGVVYREVLLHNLLEMLTLTAKLNAIGYRLNPALKEACGWHYAALFSRAPRPRRGGTFPTGE